VEVGALGGLPDLLDRFPVASLIVPVGFVDGINPDAGAVVLLDQARGRGVPVIEVAAGESWRAGPFRFDARHPLPSPSPGSEGGSDNGRSLVLDVAAPGGRLLLTGDLEGPGLVAMPDRLPVATLDVMLAPHHGGRLANMPWLYEATKPRLVVVSQRTPVVGTRDPLTELRQPVLRTWEVGAVLLGWSATGISARGYREGENQAATGGSGPFPTRR
jgi:competence protein ComEC